MAEGFENLVVWQRAHALMLLVHEKIVPLLPPEEKWDLVIQLRRCSKSIGANISEAYGRFYYREAIRFCYTARGSLAETQNGLIDAKDLHYILPELYQQARGLADETYRLLNGYIRYLKKQTPGKAEFVSKFRPDPSERLISNPESQVPNPESQIPSP